MLQSVPSQVIRLPVLPSVPRGWVGKEGRRRARKMLVYASDNEATVSNTRDFSLGFRSQFIRNNFEPSRRRDF